MNIVVVGDVLLDKDVSGSASRLSPDGPVPVLDVTRVRYRPGGAGLVAALLARDAERSPMRVSLVTAVSDDDAAQLLRSALEVVTRGGVEIIASQTDAPTPMKMRIRSGGHPVARVDEGCGPAPVPEATAQMIEAIGRADVLLVADYGRGITSNPQIRRALRRRARHVPLVWDPHPNGGSPVPEAVVVTPNLREVAQMTDSVETFDTAFSAGAALQEAWGCDAVAVTTGELGVVLSRRGEAPIHLPARRVESADPCGAGDRFAATLARALSHGQDLTAAILAATTQTAEFLRAGGAAQMDASLDPNSLRSPDAITLAAQVRARGGTVIATGGCFDLMHAGHARTLSAARSLGDCLIVCLNADETVSRLKGPGRPIMSQEDRIEMLTSLECVDAVVVFEEDTPSRILRQLRPHVWVKGGDYRPADLPEAHVLADWGGRVEVMPTYLGRSTTLLVSAIEEAS